MNQQDQSHLFTILKNDILGLGNMPYEIFEVSYLMGIMAMNYIELTTKKNDRLICFKTFVHEINTDLQEVFKAIEPYYKEAIETNTSYDQIMDNLISARLN